MAPAIRDRFLIALAKFFGEEPRRENPLPSIQLCSPELMGEILATVLKEEEVRLTCEQFNQIMVCCRHRLATKHFFEYFFLRAKTIDDFERAVDCYRTKAMLLFGNFRFAYRRLATCNQAMFQKLIDETEPLSEDKFSIREPFTEIEKIPVSDLYLLGYIAKAELDDLELAHAALQQLTPAKGDRGAILRGIKDKLIGVIKKHGIAFSTEELDQLSEKELEQVALEIKALVEPLRAARASAVAIGTRNTDRYITLPHLDVYVATSMRDKEDFKGQHAFTNALFSDPQIEPLRLRYFDPTLSYVEDRITKGLIEMLMLRRASVTIYVAGATDTLGKDSELAATLAQGKPVIVYVPKGEVPQSCGAAECKRKVNYDRRAENFREDHPLGIQIAVTTGVAHGIIVVRSEAECAKVLRKVMLRQLSFTIEHEKGVIRLRENDSRSVVRVVSDNPLLTHAFWTYFNMQ